jgi:hypothetical protein
MIAHIKNKMLFEIRPDILPPYLTDFERILWGLFYQKLNREREHGRRK